MKQYICPSLLSANFANLEADIENCSNADMLHVDIMDGHFVPNITIGPVVVESVRRITTLPLDVHLMISEPEKYAENFVRAGADYITIHAESALHLDRVLSFVKSLGVKVGISLVPSTHENILKYILEYLDLILVMTVNPGFGGQKFLLSQVPKVIAISKMIKTSGKEIILQVDGGIDDQTIKICREAGANAFVSGSYIFKEKKKISEKIELLRR